MDDICEIDVEQLLDKVLYDNYRMCLNTFEKSLPLILIRSNFDYMQVASVFKAIEQITEISPNEILTSLNENERFTFNDLCSTIREKLIKRF